MFFVLLPSRNYIFVRLPTYIRCFLRFTRSYSSSVACNNKHFVGVRTNVTVDDVVLIWVNGTNTIMTDNYASSTDPRIKPGTPLNTPGFVEHTLIIEQVTRWDSGSYKCQITSSPPVSITHTLRVIRQYTSRLSIHFIVRAALSFVNPAGVGCAVYKYTYSS